LGLFVFELSPVAVLLAELLAADPSNCANVDKLLLCVDGLPAVAKDDSR